MKQKYYNSSKLNNRDKAGQSEIMRTARLLCSTKFEVL